MAGFPMELSPGSSNDDASVINNEVVTSLSQNHESRKFLQPTQSTSIPVPVRTVNQLVIHLLSIYI